ncbi:MAG: DUF2341 domain-containing protein, partial [Candidatus Heimdallarchaeota archaeon]
NSDKILYVGCRMKPAGIGEYFPGYIDELRVSKGVARWTSNFIPPAGPYGSSWDNRKKIAVTTTVSGIETQLYTEIEYWDSINEQAYLWTKVPTIVSGTNTDLYLYYDINHTTNSGYIGDTGEVAAQNVWDSNFKAVYHLTQDPVGGSNCMWDSTSNVNHGTPGGTMTSDDLVDGKVGKALDFDGGDDSIDLGNAASLNPAYITLEAILKTIDTGYSQIITKDEYVSAPYERVWQFKKNQTDGNLCLIVFKTDTDYDQVVGTSNLSDDSYHHVVGTWDGVVIKVYVDTILENSKNYSGSLQSGQSNNAFIGRREDTTNQDWWDGILDEIRMSNTARSDVWIKATYYSNWNDLITFSEKFISFVFSNPIPIPASTVYGTSQTLRLTVTVSGEDSSYIYDASFFDASDDSQVGSTISGTNSGNYVSTVMSTPSATSNSWYLFATSSGESDTSSTYSFDNKFLCRGTTEVNGALTSGIPVRLYLRSDGSYVGGTTSTGVSGTFEIETDHNEHHYAIAIIHPDDEDTNAEIFDWLKP